MGHIHAELMALYAEDARTHADPWKLWQVKNEDGLWRTCGFGLRWDPFSEYQRKPNTHTVNGVEVPDLRIIPKDGEGYWHPDPNIAELALKAYHRNDLSSKIHRLANNLCYEDTADGKQAAILHAKAWLGI